MPAYLNKYKAEFAEEAAKKEERRQAKLLPKGMKKMDEAERLETLE